MCRFVYIVICLLTSGKAPAKNIEKNYKKKKRMVCIQTQQEAKKNGASFMCFRIEKHSTVLTVNDSISSSRIFFFLFLSSKWFFFWRYATNSVLVCACM